MTQADGKIQYFLGANSAQGFVSLYNELIDESNAAAFYILKGGPGCGKSTLMKTIGAELEKEGVRIEYILCSGDPSSLDAILLPDMGIAIMDGTAPHGRISITQKQILFKSASVFPRSGAAFFCPAAKPRSALPVLSAACAVRVRAVWGTGRCVLLGYPPVAQAAPCALLHK